MKLAKLLCTVLLFSMITSCISITPHEHFILIMQSYVGKNIHDPSVKWMDPDRLIRQPIMTNGILEYGYRLYPGCNYYFEVDPKSEVVIRWRFEGDESNCKIPY